MPLSLEQLYQRHFLPLHRFAVGLTGSVDEANDIVQTIFTRLASHHEPDFKAVTTAYLYTAVRNGAKDFWKRQRPIPLSTLTIENTEGDETIFDIPDTTPGPLENVTTAQDLDMLLESLQKLTEEQREVITLKYFSELTTTEIAQALGKNENSLRQLEFRALRSLRRLISNQNL